MELTAALGEWSSSTMTSGGKCAVINGTKKQLRWCVRNLTVELQKVSKKSSTTAIAT